MDEALLKDAIAVLRALTTNPHLSLDDLVYAVREREQQGWMGPSVTLWNSAVMGAKAVLNRADKAGL